MTSWLPAQVFPDLYLPVMEEGNKRVLRPHRKYLPTPAWFAFKYKMAKLNSFLVNLIRERWSQRQAGEVPGRGDILDRILQAIQVNSKGDSSPAGFQHSAMTLQPQSVKPA